MALDMYLVFDPASDIKGETADDEYKSQNAIELLSWSWGASQSGTMHSATGGGAGRADLADFSFSKYTDKSTVGLAKALVSGQHIPKATLALRKAGTTPQKYLEMTFTNVIVSSFQSGGASGGDDRIIESASLNFQEVKIEYFAQDDTGTVASAGSITYDVAARKWA